MRRAAVIAILLLTACAPSDPAAPDVRVVIEAQAEGSWRVEYRFSSPQRRVDLGAHLDGFRAKYWRVSSAGVAIAVDGARDVLQSDKPFSAAALLVEPRADILPKDYQAFTPMGERGVLLYTGAFIPYKDDGQALETRFDIAAPEGFYVSAFDATAPALKDWKSPHDAPAFIYVGPARPIETEAVSAIVDERAPAWIRAEFARLAPPLFRALADGLGGPLKTRPNLFLTIGELSPEGKLSLRGDALPGQFQETAVGGAWLQRSDKALRVMQRVTAHESAHLFQLASGSFDRTPAYLHEGGAEALAAEALARSGLWSEADADAWLSEAVEECGRLTQSRSLAKVAADDGWAAAYACGHVLTVIASGRAGPAALWRRLAEQARAGGGYDEAMFFAAARDFAGAEIAAGVESFVRTSYARPERELAKLLEAAQSAPALGAAPAR